MFHRFSRAALATTAAVAATLALSACGATADDDSTLSVGATAVPAAEILQFVIDSGQAEEAGLTLRVQEYADYVTPNQALSDGTNDVNLFQHEPYLNLYNSESGDDLVAVGVAGVLDGDADHDGLAGLVLGLVELQPGVLERGVREAVAEGVADGGALEVAVGHAVRVPRGGRRVQAHVARRRQVRGRAVPGCVRVV